MGDRKAQAGGQVLNFDLTGSERHLRSAIGSMERIASGFSRLARRSMPFLARYRSRIAAGTVKVVDVQSQILPDPPVYTVAMTSSDGFAWATITLDANAIALTLEGAMGGGSTSIDASSLGTDLSPAQRALLGRIVRSLADDLANAIKEESRLVLSPIAGTLPDQSSADGTPNILQSACEIEGLPTPAFLIISAGAEAIEAAGGRGHAEEEPSQGDPRVADALMDVPMELIAELGRVTMGLQHVLDLRVGDVIRLPTATDDTIGVRVGGVEKFAAVPATSRGQLAIEIRGRHEG